MQNENHGQYAHLSDETTKILWQIDTIKRRAIDVQEELDEHRKEMQVIESLPASPTKYAMLDEMESKLNTLAKESIRAAELLRSLMTDLTKCQDQQCGMNGLNVSYNDDDGLY